jgi:hypothetical protein
MSETSRATGRVLGKEAKRTQITIISGRGKHSTGVMRDRSLGGIGIDAEEDLNLQAGKTIDLELDSPLGPIQLEGTVAWCEGKRAGIRFEHLSMLELKKWLELFFDGVDLSDKDEED